MGTIALPRQHPRKSLPADTKRPSASADAWDSRMAGDVPAATVCRPSDRWDRVPYATAYGALCGAYPVRIPCHAFDMHAVRCQVTVGRAKSIR